MFVEGYSRHENREYVCLNLIFCFMHLLKKRAENEDNTN